MSFSIELLLAQNPSREERKAKRYNEKGWELFKNGDTSGAFREFSQAIDLNANGMTRILGERPVT